MAVHKITKGLDLPISGRPVQVIRERATATRVAVVADDFPGMKPKMRVEEGDTVKRGQVLFEDRKSEGVFHTAPGAGRVIGIHRGGAPSPAIRGHRLVGRRAFGPSEPVGMPSLHELFGQARVRIEPG